MQKTDHLQYLHLPQYLLKFTHQQPQEESLHLEPLQFQQIQPLEQCWMALKQELKQQHDDIKAALESQQEQPTKPHHWPCVIVLLLVLILLVATVLVFLLITVSG